MTEVPLTKTIKKEVEVKKEGEGKTKEKKNKEDDHSTTKLERSAMYRCKFDKKWSKKNPCHSANQRRPPCLFLYNLFKEISCSYQAFVKPLVKPL